MASQRFTKFLNVFSSHTALWYEGQYEKYK